MRIKWQLSFILRNMSVSCQYPIVYLTYMTIPWGAVSLVLWSIADNWPDIGIHTRPEIQNHRIHRKMIYRQTSYIRGTKSKHLYVSRLVLQLSLPNPSNSGVSREWWCSWTGAARTTYEESTISLPIKARLTTYIRGWGGGGGDN